jgi:multiple sugar transport system ATP-binding protein
MAQVVFENVTKKYGRLVAVKNLTFECKDKELVCLLGPSGAGKTSTLRMVGGLEEINEGNIYIDGVCVNTLHPSKRDVAMVFETYALYPHKTVFENISYPLQLRKEDPAVIEKKVRKAMKILDIEELRDRYPKQLSGGQKQRVAVGRSIVRNPKVFLMDEPIAHLDAKLRAHMRVELKHLQKELDETFLYATHDQLEALSMADRIAVIDHGVLQQFDTADMIYNHPENVFVAGFIGDIPINFFQCELKSKGGELHLKHETFLLKLSKTIQKQIEKKGAQFTGSLPVILGIRPEDIKLSLKRKDSEMIEGVLYLTEPLGADVIVDVRVGSQLIKVLTDASFKGKRDDHVFMGVNMDQINLFDQQSKKAIM